MGRTHLSFHLFVVKKSDVQMLDYRLQEIKMTREDGDTGYLPRLNCSDKEGQDQEIRCPMNFLARQLTMSPY